MKTPTILILFNILYITAERPIYDCTQPCNKTIIDNITQKYVFLTKEGETQEITLNTQLSSHMQLLFARKYIHQEMELYINDVNQTNIAHSNIIFNSFMQIVKYLIRNETIVQSTNIKVKSLTRDIRWEVNFGEKYQTTLLEAVSIPIDMFHLHGSYWSGLFYDWIFLAVTAVISVLFLSSNFGYQRFIPSLLIYATAAFAASAAAKIYHIILCSFRLSDKSEILFAIFVNTLCIEILPILYCYIHYRLYYYLAYIIGTLTIIISIVLILVGSSYYIGPALLGMSGIITILRKFFLG